MLMKVAVLKNSGVNIFMELHLQQSIYIQTQHINFICFVTRVVSELWNILTYPVLSTSRGGHSHLKETGMLAKYDLSSLSGCDITFIWGDLKTKNPQLLISNILLNISY